MATGAGRAGSDPQKMRITNHDSLEENQFLNNKQNGFMSKN